MKKKISRLLVALPFWVCVMTLVFGMLHMDVGEGESHVPYGWYFLLIGLLPAVLLYIVGFVANVSFAIHHFFRSKSKLQKRFSLLYLVAAIWATVYFLCHLQMLGFYVVLLAYPVYIFLFSFYIVCLCYSVWRVKRMRLLFCGLVSRVSYSRSRDFLKSFQSLF